MQLLADVDSPALDNPYSFPRSIAHHKLIINTGKKKQMGFLFHEAYNRNKLYNGAKLTKYYSIRHALLVHQPRSSRIPVYISC